MFFLLAGSLLGASQAAMAQILPDDTLPGERSVVTSGVNVRGLPAELIEGGAQRNSNLFHSFLEFNVDAGQRVYFTNPAETERIFSRVTGANPSSIDGLLGVDGLASLYFLNPNGVMFGPEASLDVLGSFVVSTAEGFGFEDGSEFSAVELGDNSLLTVSVPLGLQVGPEPRNGSAISNQGSLISGQDLALFSDRMNLSGQVEAESDLYLLALDTTTIRDTAIAPFIAQAGNQLIVQGNNGIDILTVQHLDSISFISGGNLTLLSNERIFADSHFESGGNFQILTDEGKPGDFVSFYNPVILADGNILFGNYRGVSLKIEATGNIQAGDIRITNADCVAGTPGCIGGVSPSDPDVAILTSSLAAILRTGANANKQSSGSITVESVDTSNSARGNGGPIVLEAEGDLTTGNLRSYSFGDINSGVGGDITLSSRSGNITTNGSVSSYSIASYGVTGPGGDITLSAPLGYITTNRNLTAFSLSTYGESGAAGNITLSAMGDITTNGTLDADSRVLVSNPVEFNATGSGGDITLSSKSGNITTHNNLNAFSSSSWIYNTSVADGGDIILLASLGNIVTNGALSAHSFANTGTSRSGGDITIIAPRGSITTNGPLTSYSNASVSVDGTGGNINLSSGFGITTLERIDSGSRSLGQAGVGGNIDLSTVLGDIYIDGALFSSSTSSSSSTSTVPTSGGNILLFSQSGNIDINERLDSFVLTGSGAVGNAGDVRIAAPAGYIQGKQSEIFAFSVAEEVNQASGEGGIVNLQAQDEISSIRVLTLSSDGVSGTIDIQGQGNLLVRDVRLIASARVETSNPFSPDEPIILDINGFGQSGNIIIHSNGNLILRDSQVISDANGSSPAGNVKIFSPGWIIFSNSILNSNTNSTGRAGNIEVAAGQGIHLTGAVSQLLAQTNAQGPAGSIFVNAPQVIVENNAQISATSSRGQGGNITINGNDTVRIDNGIITSELLKGASDDGERIEVFAGNLELLNGAEIRTVSVGDGNAGNIILNIEDIIQAQDGSILTNSETTAGGIITVNAPNVRLLGDSDIVSFVNNGEEGGGNIVFNGDTVVALDDSDILAFAADGRGGDISFNTAFFGQNYQPAPPGTDPRTLDNNARVDVNASGAIDGVISISDVSFIQNSLNELSDALVDPNTLTAGSCIARTGESTGSFTTTGTDGLPQRPSDTAGSQFPAVEVAPLTDENTPIVWHPDEPIVEPNAVYQLIDGRFLMGRECS